MELDAVVSVGGLWTPAVGTPADDSALMVGKRRGARPGAQVANCIAYNSFASVAMVASGLALNHADHPRMPSYQSWRKGLGAEPAPKGIKETVLAARPVATHSVARLMERHGDVKLPDLLAYARRLPEGALGQHPRSLQGGVQQVGCRERLGGLDEHDVSDAPQALEFAVEGDAADAIDAAEMLRAKQGGTRVSGSR